MSNKLQVETSKPSEGSPEQSCLVKETKSTEIDGQVEPKRNIRADMANMPLGELMALREKLGTKVLDRTIFGEPSERSSRSTFKKDNKKRPREMSSKVPVSVYRDVFQPNSKMRRDPRFDDSCGSMNEAIFRKDYQFVDELKVMERKDLKKQLREETDDDRVEEIKLAIQRIDNQKRSVEEKVQKKKILRELRQKNAERLKLGKAPVFVPRGELKKAELVDKFQSLKQAGRVDKYVKKKLKAKKIKSLPPAVV